jgi:hypothetical protein
LDWQSRVIIIPSREARLGGGMRLGARNVGLAVVGVGTLLVFAGVVPSPFGRNAPLVSSMSEPLDDGSERMTASEWQVGHDTTQLASIATRCVLCIQHLCELPRNHAHAHTQTHAIAQHARTMCNTHSIAQSCNTLKNPATLGLFPHPHPHPRQVWTTGKAKCKYYQALGVAAAARR